jgi:hypothetical protein
VENQILNIQVPFVSNSSWNKNVRKKGRNQNKLETFLEQPNQEHQIKNMGRDLRQGKMRKIPNGGMSLS